jgi:hypothetical protein
MVMKPMHEVENLAIEITDAAGMFFRALFENGKRYYYCTVVGSFGAGIGQARKGK